MSTRNRILAGAAVLLVSLAVPGCTSTLDEEGYSEGSVSVGVAVYGAPYYGPGWGGCCYGGGVVVVPGPGPIRGGGGAHVSPR